MHDNSCRLPICLVPAGKFDSYIAQLNRLIGLRLRVNGFDGWPVGLKKWAHQPPSMNDRIRFFVFHGSSISMKSQRPKPA